MARDTSKIDKPGPDSDDKRKEYPALRALLKKQQFAFDGKPGHGAPSDASKVANVAFQWYETADGKENAASPRQAETLAWTEYWKLWREEKGV